MLRHSNLEVSFNTNVCFARVPTEANLADLPSRGVEHPPLPGRLDASSLAEQHYASFREAVERSRCELKRKGEAGQLHRPKFKKVSSTALAGV